MAPAAVRARQLGSATLGDRVATIAGQNRRHHPCEVRRSPFELSSFLEIAGRSVRPWISAFDRAEPPRKRAFASRNARMLDRSFASDGGMDDQVRRSVCVGVAPRRSTGLRAAGNDGSTRPRARRAGRHAAGRDRDRAEPGHRHVPRDVSGADGTFFVGGIVPGLYEITAELQGFKKLAAPGRPRSRSARPRRSICSSQSASCRETVTVSAESPLVDVTTKEVGGNITGRELVDLPSINRNFIGFIGLLPGIVPSISTESFGSDSISVNGSDPRNNNYMLDGGNNNDDVIGQRAGTQARTAIESVQEFQVITNQFDAQFGRTTGAIINAVTKSGTNVFHGSALRLRPGRRLDRQGLLRQGARPEQAGHPAPRVRRHARRPDRQGQGALLRQPRARDDRSRRGARVPGRPDLNWSPTTQDRVWNTMVEVRPAAQRQPHLGRALAARAVAAAQPGDRPGHARRDPRRRRQGPDGRRRRCRRCSAAPS